MQGGEIIFFFNLAQQGCILVLERGIADISLIVNDSVVDFEQLRLCLVQGLWTDTYSALCPLNEPRTLIRRSIFLSYVGSHYLGRQVLRATQL